MVDRCLYAHLLGLISDGRFNAAEIAKTKKLDIPVHLSLSHHRNASSSRRYRFLENHIQLFTSLLSHQF